MELCDKEEYVRSIANELATQRVASDALQDEVKRLSRLNEGGVKLNLRLLFDAVQILLPSVMN